MVVEATRSEQGLGACRPAWQEGFAFSASVEGDRDSESMRESAWLRRRHARATPGAPSSTAIAEATRTGAGGGVAKMHARARI